MIIEQKKSIIPACDVDAERYEQLVRETADLPHIGGYKLGFVLGLSIGLPRAVEIARKYTNKPLIYDHQKAGTDIPDTGKAFFRVMKETGIDAAIIFPQAGPDTERAWIEAAREEEVGIIVGGLMTHKGYLRSDGGYIADEAVIEMYTTAARMKVLDYVVPGNNPEAIAKIRTMIERHDITPTLYSPGFVAQGGSVSDSSDAAGGRFHAIVGRGIYNADDMRAAAEKLGSQLG
jgi:orotidine-5'-phosphate decarboxylase